jgi:hypothetical protein
MAAVAGATLVGSAISANAAGKAASAQAGAARDASDVAYRTSQDQIAAQKEALDKQIAASGATVDKQLVAQRDALAAQLSQTAEGLAFQKMMYEQSRADFAPYRESGTANLNQLNTLLGIGGNTGAADYGRFKTADFTPANFAANQDPGYGFRMSEGLKAVDRQAAARGGLISGNAFNRFQTIRGNTLSPFQSGAAAGQSAAAMQGASNAAFGNAGANAAAANNAAYGAFGQGASGAYGNQGQATNAAYGNYGQGVSSAYGGYGTNAANALMGGANAAASGYVGGANAINAGISGLSNAYYQNRMLDMFGNRGSTMSDAQANAFMGSYPSTNTSGL